MQKIYVGQKIGSFTITEYFEYYHEDKIFFDFKAACNICNTQISMKQMTNIDEVKQTLYKNSCEPYKITPEKKVDYTKLKKNRNLKLNLTWFG